MTCAQNAASTTFHAYSPRAAITALPIVSDSFRVDRTAPFNASFVASNGQICGWFTIDC